VLPPALQVPEAFPIRPPPSNTVVETDVPMVELAMPEDAPVIELAVPGDAPVVEVVEPKEACGIEPPKPEHPAVLLDIADVAGPVGETPDVVGLTPSDPSSVAPKPIPVCGTGAAGPMPSGEVMPSGDGAEGEPAAAEPGCANAELVPRKAVTITGMNKSRILGFPFSSCWNRNLGQAAIETRAVKLNRAFGF
jgi:hypothetical protein